MYLSTYKSTQYNMMHSMASAPVEAVNDSTESLNQEGQCDILTLDFSKALEKVPHAYPCKMEYKVTWKDKRGRKY